MKKQIPILKTLIHAAVVLVATAVVSSASAQTVAFGDLNNDGLMDRAAITSPTTVTVYLANLDGSYTVSAILPVPKTQAIVSIGIFDMNNDGVLDVHASSAASRGWVYTHRWMGYGDGTFGSRMTSRWHSHNYNWADGF